MVRHGCEVKLKEVIRAVVEERPIAIAIAIGIERVPKGATFTIAPLSFDGSVELVPSDNGAMVNVACAEQSSGKGEEMT